MAKNADMAARYPMLLDWDVGEVPYPGCFPVRMVLTLSCKECKTVKRSRGPNQYWSQDYQSKGIIIRRAIREPNKDKVMRMIMKQVGYLKQTTARAFGEPADSPSLYNILLHHQPDEELLWADADEVNDADFHATMLVFDHREGELGHATARNIEEALDPVSYTHLTLPTKRIV